MDKANGEDVLAPFNLKLPKDVKSEFKRKTHERGTTMQAVLSAFTLSYIKNPDKFQIKMEVIEE